jgi:L-alanine-DL-glutamate epimerase-like enolase superfamily enzyme
VRITDVTVVLHERAATGSASFGPGGRQLLGVLRIMTDEGIEGNSFLSRPGPGPAAIAEQIVTIVKPWLVGADPLDIGAHWRRMAGLVHYLSPHAVGSVDVALWDIAGKSAGLPVHRLLGTCRDRIPAYYSTAHYQTPGKYAEITPGGLTALPPWITAGATDFLRGDVVIKGGISGLMKIAHLAEAFGMNCEVHDSYNALNNVAGTHVMMAIDNCDWYEVLAFNRAGDHSLGHVSYGLTEPFTVDAEGYVHAPAGPGLGAGVDWPLINSSVTAVAR